MMKKTLPPWIIWLVILTFLPAAAGKVRELTWNDLIPSGVKGKDPFDQLTQKQKDMAYWVINTLESLPGRSPETEQLYKQIDEAMPTLKKEGIDIVRIMAQRQKNRTAVVETLNGQEVRMPGYLLPLEASAGKVTEFLLVPYVGACIHVPPPPPNQIVHVKIKKKGGYENKKLYEPVWVTGLMNVKSMVKELYLVDGSAGVDIGYTMQADHIEPYKP
jgi:hypothetical protein